jgi:flagellar hook-associated protein 1 FlgK
MSLFSAMHLGNNSLRAQTVGMQVTGQNIANANTPGYIREEVVFTPAPTQRLGNLLLGLGVEVTAVVQKIDLFLEERLRGATSDRASSAVKQEAYHQLEAIQGELTENDLSTSLNKFFNSIHDVLNQPESIAVRNLAALQGQALSNDIRRLHDQASDIHADLDRQVGSLVPDINRLVKDIARLNTRIMEMEGGGAIPSDAVGLRDQRYQKLTELSELISIRAEEQRDGSVTVFAGGDFLVFHGEYRTVEGHTEPVGSGGVRTTVQLVTTNSRLELTGGKVDGLTKARDEIIGDFIDRLNDFTGTFIHEFNKIYTSGQGLHGYGELTGEFAVDDTDAALDDAELPFQPVNGSLQVLVYNRQTELTETTDVTIDLNGLDDDTSLEELAATLDAIDGLTASVTTEGRLSLASETPDNQFAFGNDTSGVLAALGLGTFFTGKNASDIGVAEAVADDPATFAASQDGFGASTENAVLLGQFKDLPLETAGGETLVNLYDRLTSETTEAAAVARSVADGFRVFEETLNGQKLGISGVNLDEEAVNMIVFQRAFQASAKYIATVSELLEVLVDL